MRSIAAPASSFLKKGTFSFFFLFSYFSFFVRDSEKSGDKKKNISSSTHGTYQQARAMWAGGIGAPIDGYHSAALGYGRPARVTGGDPMVELICKFLPRPEGEDDSLENIPAVESSSDAEEQEETEEAFRARYDAQVEEHARLRADQIVEGLVRLRAPPPSHHAMGILRKEAAAAALAEANDKLCSKLERPSLPNPYLDYTWSSDLAPHLRRLQPWRSDNPEVQRLSRSQWRAICEEWLAHPRWVLSQRPIPMIDVIHYVKGLRKRRRLRRRVDAMDRERAVRTFLHQLPLSEKVEASDRWTAKNFDTKKERWADADPEVLRCLLREAEEDAAELRKRLEAHSSPKVLVDELTSSPAAAPAAAAPCAQPPAAAAPAAVSAAAAPRAQPPAAAAEASCSPTTSVAAATAAAHAQPSAQAQMPPTPLRDALDGDYWHLPTGSPLPQGNRRSRRRRPPSRSPPYPSSPSPPAPPAEDSVPALSAPALAELRRIFSPPIAPPAAFLAVGQEVIATPPRKFASARTLRRRRLRERRATVLTPPHPQGSPQRGSGRPPPPHSGMVKAPRRPRRGRRLRDAPPGAPGASLARRTPAQTPPHALFRAEGN